MIAAQRRKTKFRLGVLLDSTLVSKYILEFVTWAQSQEHLEISCALVLPSNEKVVPFGFQSFPQDAKTNDATSAVSKIFYSFIIGIERLFLLKNLRHYQHMQKFDLCAILPSGIIYKLGRESNVPAESPYLDLLVSFAMSPIATKIQSAAKFGLVALSYSDDRIRRGGPAGFWEVYFRDDVTGFTIRRQTGIPDADEVILRGLVATQFYYLLNQASLKEKSSYYLAKMVERIATTNALPNSEQTFIYCQRPGEIPKPHQTMAYFFGLIRLAALKIHDKLRGFDLRWHVAFVRSDWRSAALRRAKIIENPRGRYLADPFVISRNGRDFCYVEDYDEKSKRAKIAVYELSDKIAAYVGVALEESFHLSYPYLFEYEGELYMCPETSENREIRVYKCVDFPLRWTLAKVLMKNVSAVDNMLF